MKTTQFWIVGLGLILAGIAAGGEGCASSSRAFNDAGGGGAAVGDGGGGMGAGTGGMGAGTGGMGAGTGGMGAGTGGAGGGAGGMGAGTGGMGGGTSGQGGGAPACSSAADCRLFSSSCMVCECLALPSSEPDPICGGNMVNCFVDPCQNHNPDCDVATGECIVK